MGAHSLPPSLLGPLAHVKYGLYRLYPGWRVQVPLKTSGMAAMILIECSLLS